MKASAVAPANIAFIKYWGRRSAELRLPYNPSISMNLSNCLTTTTIEFSSQFARDIIEDGFTDKEKERIVGHLDLLRHRAGTNKRARVATKNSFPTSAGIASSASGFAALTVAGAAALGLTLTEKQLSELARMGSGSACRSIPDGFVKWEGAYAYSLYAHDYWDLRDIVVVVGYTGKNVSSTAGHEAAPTSPYFEKRIAALPKRIARCEHALKMKDFTKLGEVIEEDCLDMHHVMQTQTPPLYYWNDMTVTIMDAVKDWREDGLAVYFTIDAGPNVHVLCEGRHEKEVAEALKRLKGVNDIIINKPAKGAHLV